MKEFGKDAKWYQVVALLDVDSQLCKVETETVISFITATKSQW